MISSSTEPSLEATGRRLDTSMAEGVRQGRRKGGEGREKERGEGKK